MRLIDADESKNELYQEWFLDILLTQQSKEDMFCALAQKVDGQPTAYDVDKVVEQLRNDSSIRLYGSCNSDNYLIPVSRAIEIVKAGVMNNNSKKSD